VGWFELVECLYFLLCINFLAFFLGGEAVKDGVQIRGSELQEISAIAASALVQ